MKHHFSIEITEKIVLEYFAKLPVQERLTLLTKVMSKTRIKSIPHSGLENILDKKTVGNLFSLSMKSPREIAKKFNVDVKQIEDILIELGYKIISSRKKGMGRKPLIQNHNLVIEALNFKSVREVAKQFNVSIHTIYNIRKSHGHGKRKI